MAAVSSSPAKALLERAGTGEVPEAAGASSAAGAAMLKEGLRPVLRPSCHVVPALIVSTVAATLPDSLCI